MPAARPLSPAARPRHLGELGRARGRGGARRLPHRREHRRPGPERRREHRQRHLRRVPVGGGRPRQPTLLLPVHQLHQLRSALHDRPLGPLRPARDDHGRLQDVRRVPGRVRRPSRQAISCPAERLCRLRAQDRLLRARRAPARRVQRRPRHTGGGTSRRRHRRRQGHRGLPPGRGRHQPGRRIRAAQAQGERRQTLRPHGQRLGDGTVAVLPRRES